MSKQLEADYHFVFGSDEGKRVLSHICRECGVLNPSYQIGDDSNTVVFREGMRNMALMILTALDEKPERFIDLTKELQKNA